MIQPQNAQKRASGSPKTDKLKRNPTENGLSKKDVQTIQISLEAVDESPFKSLTPNRNKARSKTRC